ncbi:putative membrane protein [Wickerhamomyces ciferrii]|uniref:Membrane protein n=1 Tax=Wickerhamomyces ciferrii (strain ATCC 14091 / BCRC 22168 / CBS 111 / JCM 3599 / NBRC 0793 / NRRL Y-1031 F-60-10) TaxID=1206466 RepID=K0KWS0_WICCF|nr:uncharacterized protein BN7_5526 [Wickerhamomyces ciferrii]CCH45939.1 putative membrane protein [Wickerhamomyces ciferrii]
MTRELDAVTCFKVAEVIALNESRIFQTINEELPKDFNKMVLSYDNVFKRNIKKFPSGAHMWKSLKNCKKFLETVEPTYRFNELVLLILTNKQKFSEQNWLNMWKLAVFIENITPPHTENFRKASSKSQGSQSISTKRMFLGRDIDIIVDYDNATSSNQRFYEEIREGYMEFIKDAEILFSVKHQAKALSKKVVDTLLVSVLNYTPVGYYEIQKRHDIKNIKEVIFQNCVLYGCVIPSVILSQFVNNTRINGSFQIGCEVGTAIPEDTTSIINKLYNSKNSGIIPDIVIQSISAAKLTEVKRPYIYELLQGAIDYDRVKPQFRGLLKQTLAQIIKANSCNIGILTDTDTHLVLEVPADTYLDLVKSETTDSVDIDDLIFKFRVNGFIIRGFQIYDLTVKELTQNECHLVNFKLLLCSVISKYIRSSIFNSNKEADHCLEDTRPYNEESFDFRNHNEMKNRYNNLQKFQDDMIRLDHESDRQTSTPDVQSSSEGHRNIHFAELAPENSPQIDEQSCSGAIRLYEPAGQAVNFQDGISYRPEFHYRPFPTDPAYQLNTPTFDPEAKNAKDNYEILSENMTSCTQVLRVNTGALISILHNFGLGIEPSQITLLKQLSAFKKWEYIIIKCISKQLVLMSEKYEREKVFKSFDQVYREFCDVSLQSEINTLNRINKYNDSIEDQSEQLNVPKLLLRGIIQTGEGSILENEQFIALEPINYIHNHPQNKQEQPEEVKQDGYNLIRKINSTLGIKHNDIYPRNISIDPKTNKVLIFDFNKSEIGEPFEFSNDFKSKDVDNLRLAFEGKHALLYKYGELSTFDSFEVGTRTVVRALKPLKSNSNQNIVKTIVIKTTSFITIASKDPQSPSTINQISSEKLQPKISVRATAPVLIVDIASKFKNKTTKQSSTRFESWFKQKNAQSTAKDAVNGVQKQSLNSIPNGNGNGNGKNPSVLNGDSNGVTKAGSKLSDVKASKGSNTLNVPKQPEQQSKSTKEVIDRSAKEPISQERFPWEKIGGFQEKGKFDPSFVTEAQIIKTYIIETFYSDWYWSTGLVIGTCFFSWLIAKWGFGIFGLMFVLLGTASVYRAEFRRFSRNIRDDLTRDAAAERLEKNFESMEWLNSFLAKFWVIYMPALSETVMTIANDVLKDVAPGYGIDALTLDEFTLGSKSPRIDSIKSYTKKGKNVVEWDWAFSFTPDDTSDMTKNQIDKKIDPKVALGVRVGKGFVSKRLPILVEDMSVAGRVKITLNLSLNFPHIKIVSVQLLEAPKIDFGLKPVGGDTFGLDIMSLVPGLKTLITTLINSNVGPMLYAPNHLDVDVEEQMAAQVKDAIGVVAVTVRGAEDLKSNEKEINPYVQLHLESEADKFVRTEVKADTKSPRWNDTKYIIVNSLEQKLSIEVHNFILEDKKGSLIGSHLIELADLLQTEAIVDKTGAIDLAGKKKGSLNYDIRWFPVIESEKSSVEDESKEVETPDTEVGIFKLVVHQAKKLDYTTSLTGQLNPKAEVFVNGKSTKKFRTLKRANEPSWEENLEMLVTQKSSTKIKFVISDSGSDEDIIASFEESLDTLVFNTLDGNDVFELNPQGNVRITATWKPVSLSGVSAAANYVPPIGVARLHLREGHDLLNLEKVGKVDPYVKVLLNNRLKHQTVFYPDTLDPNFNEVIYLPISSQSQHVSLEVMDEQNLGKDRSLGSCDFPIGKFINKDEQGNYLFYDGSNKILKSDVALKGKGSHGTLTYSVSFLPAIPVYSLTELKELDDKKEKIAEKKELEAKQLKEWDDLYKKSPNEYEWIEIADEDEFNEDAKEKLSLEQLLTYRSGTLGINITKGKTKKADTFIQVLVDDCGSPAYVSGRSSARNVNPDSGEAFIRDLPNSKIVFRNTKKQNVDEKSHLLGESVYNTIDLLQRGYYEPIRVGIDGAEIYVRFEYIPSAIKLPPSETILDTGKAKIEFLDGEDLPSHDRNENISPTWNEGQTVPIPSRARSNLVLAVHDWDRTGSNDLLASTRLDISHVKPLTSEIVHVQLQPQGTVRLRVSFVPEYIRPEIGASEFGVNLSSIAGAPLKAVGMAGDLATGVAGAGVGVVGAGVGASVGAVGKGGSLFKNVLTGKKSKKSLDQPRGSTDGGSPYANDVQSMRSGHSKSTKSKEEGGALAAAQEENEETASTYTTQVQNKKVTKGTLIIRSATNLSGHAQVRVSLAINEKLKDIYKTKTGKAVNQVINWDEETTFEAPQDAEVVFGGVVHHRLSKDQEIGTGSIKLTEVIDSPRDVEIQVGQGTLIVAFRYSPEPEEGQEGTPPPPGW